MPVEPMVIILGAGQPFAGTEPSALVQTSGDRRALDWILEAFKKSLSDPEIHFVGGYRLEEIIEEYPDIHFSHNEDWESSGTISSLFTAPIPDDRPLYICYADTIFEPSVVTDLNTNELVTTAVDTSWQTRYRSRTTDSLERAEKVTLSENRVTDAGIKLNIDDADAEFTGLVRFSPEALTRARNLWQARALDDQANLPDLLRALSATDQIVTAVDIGDCWAELETAEDVARFVLDTKANTLRRLRSMVEQSTILDQYTFTVGEYRNNPEEIHAAIPDALKTDTVIIRSSALAEDGWKESNAGAFESVLDVPTNDGTTLAAAIDKVIDSYPNDDPQNQVLVQPMVDEVDQSGVVMTRALDGHSPYYVINYDATTASTESVTDGTGEHLRTAIIRKDIVTNGVESVDGDDSLQISSETQSPTGLDLDSLLTAVRELEELIGHDSLDIEFAIDNAGTVYVLQARPITLDPAERSVNDKTLFETVDAAREKFQQSQQSSPFILGDRTIYGVMPDWNPAEIIGRQPRQLAASLYRYLVMDEIWATQRAEYGYRDVRPQRLMKQFAGQPYVDVRADFNSFIPESVPDDLVERLVNYYLDRLEANPELHDKVEFDIALTCLTFDYDEQIEPLIDGGFTREELKPFREGLREITQEAYDRINEDYETIERLDSRYEELTSAGMPPLQTAYHLLEDCRRLGTLPFAHLARTAFVATSLLRSLERIGVLTSDQRSAFQNSLNTVARQFEADAYLVATDELSWKAFVDEYGHLRPGTYEITSPTYAAAPEEYLRPIVENATESTDHPGPTEVWDDETKADIERELDRIGLPTEADAFIEFLVNAIEGREHAKFIFSRNLSDALELIVEFGNQHDLTRDELSHVHIKDFFELTVDHPPSDIDDWLAERIHEGRTRHAVTQAVELPPLLFDEQDFLVFERPAREPNFVTNDTVTADAIEIDGDDDPAAVDGKIILIPQADPGYDWLFGHDIAGLITKYGGSNSHMAVRAAEFSLSAAIGVGENRYDQLRHADVIELNCDGRYTEVIQ